MKKIAITGATGFLADELIKTLIEKGYHINAIARNEGNLVALKKKYKNLTIYPVPIEDICLLKKAFKDCEGVYHLASFKDVILAESNPTKTVQTNILGTLNVLKLSSEMKNIKFVISSSTDKAVKISGIYGATKMIIEKLFYEYHHINGDKCKYRLVRYGNIFYSTGSVLVKWKEALLNNEEVIITNPKATRFFLSKQDAVNLLINCLKNSTSPKPCYYKMKSIEIGELLNLMIKKYSKGIPKIKEIGLQKGENMHEYIDSEISSFDAERWKLDELYEII